MCVCTLRPMCAFWRARLRACRTCAWNKFRIVASWPPPSPLPPPHTHEHLHTHTHVHTASSGNSSAHFERDAEMIAPRLSVPCTHTHAGMRTKNQSASTTPSIHIHTHILHSIYTNRCVYSMYYSVVRAHARPSRPRLVHLRSSSIL